MTKTTSAGAVHHPHHPHLHLEAIRGSHAVKAIIALPGFRRLYGARLGSQWADGMFQASLAGTVLFNPQHAATPADMAASFAVMLLPYSLIGPFVGVLLDRYSRRHLMTVALLLRALTVVVTCAVIWSGYQGFWFFVLALLSLSLSRFFLSGLSAGLPHVVPRNTLVTANAFSTTSGTVISIIGGACSIGLLTLVGKNDHGYAIVAVTSLLGSLLAAWLMSQFAPSAIGPDHATRESAQRVVDVLRGVHHGMQHIAAHREVAGVLMSIAAHRFIFGAVGVSMLLQFKNHVPFGGLVPQDFAGIGMALGIGGVGALIAASITPAATRAMGKNAWIVGAYGVLGTTAGLVLLVDRPWSMILASFFLGFAGQAVKVCADTIAQETIDESFQGRTFAVYDTSFNVSFVLGVVLGTVLLPESGRNAWFFVSIAVLYAAVALLYRVVALKHEVRR